MGNILETEYRTKGKKGRELIGVKRNLIEVGVRIGNGNNGVWFLFLIAMPAKYMNLPSPKRLQSESEVILSEIEGVRPNSSPGRERNRS